MTIGYFDGQLARRYGISGPLDQADEAILAERIALLDTVTEPRNGDYVIFADDKVRRISHVWQWDADDNEPAFYGLQTSDSGSWHLGKGGCSFSGGLHPSVPRDTLTLTDEKREGSCWFFHHDIRQAEHGVTVNVPFRVYRCSTPST